MSVARTITFNRSSGQSSQPQSPLQISGGASPAQSPMQQYEQTLTGDLMPAMSRMIVSGVIFPIRHYLLSLNIDITVEQLCQVVNIDYSSSGSSKKNPNYQGKTCKYHFKSSKIRDICGEPVFGDYDYCKACLKKASVQDELTKCGIQIPPEALAKKAKGGASGNVVPSFWQAQQQVQQTPPPGNFSPVGNPRPIGGYPMGGQNAQSPSHPGALMPAPLGRPTIGGRPAITPAPIPAKPMGMPMQAPKPIGPLQPAFNARPPANKLPEPQRFAVTPSQVQTPPQPTTPPQAVESSDEKIELTPRWIGNREVTTAPSGLIFVQAETDGDPFTIIGFYDEATGKASSEIPSDLDGEVHDFVDQGIAKLGPDSSIDGQAVTDSTEGQ